MPAAHAEVEAFVVWDYRPIDDGRPRQRGRVRVDLAAEPCPCVNASGMAGRGMSQFWLEIRRPPAA